MAAPFDPSKSVHVGESMSEVVVLSKDTVNVPVLDWKSAMEMNWPLPPLPHHNNSSTPAKSRADATLDEAVEYELKHGSNFIDPNIDERTLRRTISNRLAAQRSRIRKWNYKINLEKKHKDLEELVKRLNSEIETCKEKKKVELDENISLRTAVVIRTNEENIAQANMEQMRREIIRLKEKLRKKNQDSGQLSSVAVELNRYNNTEIYEQRLNKFKINQQLINPAESEREELGMINFDDDGVDQYLNWDDIVNLDLETIF